MFEIVFGDAKLFKDCADALVTLITDGEFLITKEGIKLRAMDPSQIAMVDFFLPVKAFEKYDVPSDTRIGVNLTNLSRITSRYRPGEKLELALDKSKSRLDLVFRGKHTRKFNMPLLDISGTTPKEPKIEFDASIKMNASAFKEALKDAALVSSHVILKADGEGFEISSHGDKGEVLIETKKEDDVMLEHTVNAESRAMFPLEYLNDLLKAAGSDAVISVDLKTDAPLRVKYNIADAVVTYYLAPRVENI